MAKKTKSPRAKTTKKPATKVATKKSEHGQIFFQWAFPEHELHERKRGWYIAAALLAIGFITYGIWIENYLFIVIVLIIALIYGLNHMQRPLEIMFQINEDGIYVGQRFFKWKELKDFWIAYDPPEVKRLYITHKKKLFPQISIPLEDFNPVAIRRVLVKYLKEDLEQEEELPTDTLSRILKL